MTKVVDMLRNGYTAPDGRKITFDRIVLDTAPTGHTLRMLALPDFLQQLLEKFKTVRDKAGSLGGMMGGGTGGGDMSSENPPVDRLSALQERMEELENLLHNPGECEFTVVTIPTELATAESMRLLAALDDEAISVRRVIVNQVLPGSNEEASEQDREASASAFLDRLRSGQAAALSQLEGISANTNVDLVRVPYLDVEARTVYGLRAISQHIC